MVLYWTKPNLVCCVCPGYLKKHHSALFHPPLPLHKLHSVQRLGFGTNNKIFVEFDSPWWDADCEVIYLVWEDEVRCQQNKGRFTWRNVERMQTFKLSCFISCLDSGRHGGPGARYPKILDKEAVCLHCAQTHWKVGKRKCWSLPCVVSLYSIENNVDLEYSLVVPRLSGTATSCVVGSLDMNPSIWRHCLNKRSRSPSRNSSADLQVMLIS